MSAIAKSMKRCFKFNFLFSADREVNWNVEAVCVVVLIGNAFDFAIFFLVDLDKSARQSFSWCCNKREVKFIFLSSFVSIITHKFDNIVAHLPNFFALTLVFACQGDQSFCKSNKAICQRSMF